jgi:hypothetical protein
MVGNSATASSVSIGTEVAVEGMTLAVGVSGNGVARGGSVGELPGKLHDEIVTRAMEIKIESWRFMIPPNPNHKLPLLDSQRLFCAINR